MTGPPSFHHPHRHQARGLWKCLEENYRRARRVPTGDLVTLCAVQSHRIRKFVLPVCVDTMPVIILESPPAEFETMPASPGQRICKSNTSLRRDDSVSSLPPTSLLLSAGLRCRTGVHGKEQSLSSVRRKSSVGHVLRQRRRHCLKVGGGA